MKETISIELTEDQINKIVEYRQLKTPKHPETYSIIGAAKEIGIGKTKIYSLIKSGQISTVKIGLSPRICRAEIDKFLNAPQS